MKHLFIASVCKTYEVGIKYRRYIFSSILFLWILAVFTFTNIQLNNSSVVLLPDSSVQLQRMARGMDLAPFSRLLFVDFYHPKGDADSLLQAVDILKASIPQNLAVPISQNLDVTPEKLMALLPVFFTEEAEKYVTDHIQNSSIAQSVQNAVITFSTFANNTLIHWLRVDPLNWKGIVTQNLPIALNMPTSDMVSNYATSADTKHVLLVLQPLFSMHDTDAATKILTLIRTVTKKLPPDVSINLHGGAMHTAANSETITHDVEKIVLFSFVGLACIYIFLVRSLAGIWLLLTPCLAISFSLGIMTGISASLSGLALGFGAAVLGIAEDYAVHVHFALQKERNATRIVQFLTVPLFQGFLLNASGFAVLLFSSIPAVRQLASFALLSLFFGFLIALFLLPLCPRFYKNTHCSAPSPHSNDAYKREPVLWKCLATLTILAIGCILVFSQSRIDVSPRSMGVPLDTNEMNTQNFMRIWGENSGDVVILEHTEKESLFKNTRKIAEIFDKNMNNPVSTLAYFLPSQEEQQKNITRWNTFIQNNASNIKEQISTECQLLAIDPILFNPFFQIFIKEPIFITLEELRQNGFTNLIDFFIKNNGNTENPLFQTMFISSKKIDTALLEKELISEPSIAKQLSILSPESLESEIRSVLYKEIKYIPLTLVLCTILLYLCFSNFSKVFLALIPPFSSLLCILIGMYFLQSSITLGTIAAFPLVLGLAIDHGILIAYDLENGVDLGIRKAILVSSLSTCMGMGLLAFAVHPTLRAMGQVIFFGLLIEIPVSLYILPLLCKKRIRSVHEKYI